ncbi:MAG: FCD domain-containing protein [Pseudomonadota bacterium]
MTEPQSKNAELHQPIYRLIVNEIEAMIANGQMTAGEPLPNEADLAARFGVNRSTIRESIRLLEDIGYVHRISPRKLVVAVPTPAQLALRTSKALHLFGVTLREIWEVNLAIEPAMARAAASRATEDQKAELRRNVDQTASRLSAGGPIDDLDHEFHRLLGEASNHAPLQLAREPFRDLFLDVVDGLVHHPGIGDRLLTAHGRIVEAIERGDPEVAEIWCRRHVLDFDRGCKLNGIDIDVPLEYGAATPSLGEPS